MKSTKAVNVFLLFLFSVELMTACGIKDNDPSTRYITWDSLEPDIWASLWLIKRHIDTGADIVLRPVGARTDSGIAFGVPEAKYRRSQGVSVYESLRRGYGQDDPALQELSRIIHDIDISPWGNHTSEHSAVVETTFRDLQDAFEARIVPVDCYGRFFDEVYVLLKKEGAGANWNRLYDFAHTETACHDGTSTLAKRDLSPFVRRLESHVVLDQIAAARRVVFVDAREPAEYDEFHIPGAVNIPLRDVAPGLKAQFEGADLVIPYCIKDFRGFEMARSLAEIGVRNVGIMQPYGIAGWRHLGLPVASRDGLSDAEAMEELRKCARAGTCIRNPS